MTKKEQIQGSLDARCLRHNIKLTLGVYLALLVFINLISVVVFWKYPAELLKAVLWYNGVYTVCYLPLILFHALRLRGLLKRSEAFLFGTAVLSEFHASYRSHFYFRVTFVGEDGKQYSGDTEALFRPSAFPLADFEEWNGKKVSVAYDPETERVLVLQML